MIGETEFTHHRCGTERDVIAVADVDCGVTEPFAGRSTPHAGTSLDQHRGHASLGEVGSRDQTVVTCAHDDGVNICSVHVSILAAAIA